MSLILITNRKNEDQMNKNLFDRILLLIHKDYIIIKTET
jgi:hypothetical protein